MELVLFEPIWCTGTRVGKLLSAVGQPAPAALKTWPTGNKLAKSFGQGQAKDWARKALAGTFTCIFY